MFYLTLHLLQRMGFLIATAFVVSRSKWMRSYMNYQKQSGYRWRFILLFSFFAILGTYSGVTVYELNFYPEPWTGHVSPSAAIANSRTVGVVIAGLLGGMVPGMIVGLIAGIHRYSLGGFVALACMLAPIFQGLLAGWMSKFLNRRSRDFLAVSIVFGIGFLSESIQMGLILLLARPFENAATLVGLIAFPQILANSIGVALFFILYIQIQSDEERISAQRAIKVLRIADLTLPQWVKPLEEAVNGVAGILVEETRAVGAWFQKKHEILIKVGKKTEYVIDVPIGTENNQIGVFRIFYEHEREMNDAKNVVQVGLTQLFSQQYAFVETKKQSQLLADAEIRALQAQMNPHFLFNVLNTIKSNIRTKPDEARQMITQLAKFLRQNMQNNNRSLIPIEEELGHVEAYLNLVKARMGERLEYVKEIDHDLLQHTIPPFSIQPLVENAVEHGLKQVEQGRIRISVNQVDQKVMISVDDNGKWVERTENNDHMGMALTNIERRLQFHYGVDCQLRIQSKSDQGTSVQFWVR